MQRVRVTIRHSPEDPFEDLRCAARVRRDLWAHSPVEINPGSEAHETHRDTDRNAYFEFATDFLPEVHRVVREYGYADRARVDVVEEGAGMECVNCRKITPRLASVCPLCSFRDIEPCPYCDTEVARLDYISVAGEVFECPKCHRKVRFRFTEPLSDGRGHYNQPLVLVSPAEAPAKHEV